MLRNEKNGIVAIDIGSSKIAALMFSFDENRKPSYEGHGVVASEGVRKGMIIDVEAATATISTAVTKAEDKSGMVANQAVIGIGGKHIASMKSSGMLPLEKGPRRILQDDVDRVSAHAGIIRLPEDTMVIGTAVRDLAVDGQWGIVKAVGMNALRLDVEAVLITGNASQIDASEAAVKPLRTAISGKYANAVCSAEAVLSEDEKDWGAAVVDIGAGTTDIAIYTEGSLLKLAVLPVGSHNITKDIAQVLQVPVNQAESLKVRFGTARPAIVDKDEVIDSNTLAVGKEASIGSAISRSELCRVIEARVYEIIEQVAAVLDQEGLLGRLPSGIVLTGGGSMMPYLPEYIQENLKVPAKVAKPSLGFGLPKELDFPQMASAAGLMKVCMLDLGPAAEDVGRKREKKPTRGVRELLRGLIDLN